MADRQTDKVSSPTHLSKAGEVGRAVRKDVVHSCSTADRRLGSRCGVEQGSPGTPSLPPRGDPPANTTERSPSPWAAALAHRHATAAE